LPDWFTPSFSQQILTEVSTQESKARELPRFPDWGRQLQYESLNFAHPLLKIAFPMPIERRLPYLDRRLLEYCLAVPPERKYQHLTETQKHSIRGRALQRGAFVGILPEVIRNSLVKVSFTDIHKQRFAQFGWAYRELFSPPASPEVSRFGFLKRDRFWTALSNALQQSLKNERIPSGMSYWIHRVTLLEIWLETVEDFKKRSARTNNDCADQFDDTQSQLLNRARVPSSPC
jgi:hypothetical protein